MECSSVTGLSIQQILSTLQEKVDEEISRSRFSPGAPPPINEIYTAVVENLEKNAALFNAEVQATRNAIQPFNRLPPHIITHIASSLLPDYSLLLKASGLCRAWRKTLIFSPTLWTWVKGSPSFVNLCLSRSASLPLHVIISGDASSQIIVSLKSHLLRVRSLRICLPASKLHSALDKLSTPSPMLQSFDVELPFTESGTLPATPKKILKQWSMPLLPRIFSDNPVLAELCLRNIPLTPAFLNLSSVTTAVLHHSNWPPDHILNFISANKHLERLSISGRMNHTVDSEPSRPIISLPRLTLLVLSNMNPNNVLQHINIPRGAHLELDNHEHLLPWTKNSENLSRLEDWCFTRREIEGVEEKMLTGIGPSGSIRIEWVQHMAWEVVFLSPFHLSHVRKLRVCGLDTHTRSHRFEPALSAMKHLETVIVDGASSKGLCGALARREPAPFCPSLHTLVYCSEWMGYDFYNVESVAKCRYEAPEVSPLKRLIIATNIELPSTEELRELGFYVESLELRITTQVPETWEESSSEWGCAARLVG